MPLSMWDVHHQLSGILAHYKRRPVSEIRLTIGDTSGNVYPDSTNLNVIYAHDDYGNVFTVYNQKVQNVPGNVISVGIDVEDTPHLLQVLKNGKAFGKYPAYPAIPPGISKVLAWPGLETLWVKGEQYLPWLVRPDASNPFAVDIYKGVGFSDSQMVIPTTANYDVVDLTSYVPASGAYYALISLNGDGTYTVTVPSSTASSSASITNSAIATLNYGKQPIAWVKLFSGQTNLRQEATYTDIQLARDIPGISAAGGARWGYIVGTLQDQTDLAMALANTPTPVTWRWWGDGSTTNFDLPEFWSSLIGAYDNSLRVDPINVGLSSDGSKIVFGTAPVAGHAIVADGIPMESS